MIDKRRARILREGQTPNGPVIYVMSRDQRVADNWALLYAQDQALARKQPLVVACPIAADYPELSRRQLGFVKAGLVEVRRHLKSLNIRLIAFDGSAATTVIRLAEALKAGAVVCDFNPLRESRSWKEQLANGLSVPLYEVDAHNIVPCWQASDKLEYAAYTIRPKIHRQLEEFLTPIPNPVEHPFGLDEKSIPAEWKNAQTLARGERSSARRVPVEPGETAAGRQLRLFFTSRLGQYSELRNDPNAKAQSDLSPYLHFGQLSAQRAALEAQRFDSHIPSLESFLEELIVRRELSDNFCYYNGNYDSVQGFPAWAQKTLFEHRSDPRPYLYDRKVLESAATHDELWNAAQTEMVVTGKMHGYLRMYWAKKILEWSPSPEEAMSHAIYLNNRYELDGHDPNGYAGIAWSIGGVHDRAWSEREIFGKVRYMSLGGCKRKFKVACYVDKMAANGSEVAA